MDEAPAMSKRTTPLPAALPADAVRELGHWVYLGIRFEDGRKTYAWETDEGREVQFEVEPKRGIPGCVYEVSSIRTPQGLSIITNSHQFKERLSDDSRRSQLMALHRCHETAAAAWALAQKGSLDDLDDLTLAEVRRKLWKLPIAHRRALLAVVLTRLGTMGGL